MNLTDCFTNSQRRAHNVLKKVNLAKMGKDAPDWVSVTGWLNCREQGYLISAWSPDGTLKVAVAESRNSDEMVVFFGDETCFDYASGEPSGSAHRNYFRSTQSEAAAEAATAKFISTILQQHLERKAA